MRRPTAPAPRGRRSHRPWLTAALAAAVLLPLTSATLPAAADTAAPAPAGRQQQYAAAAGRHQVPESVLLGVSYLESRWDTNAGRPSTDAGFGPMHLTDAATALAEDHHGDAGEDPRGDTGRPVGAEEFGPALTTLATAADLTGTDEDILRTEPAANIEGGAALLAHYQQDLGAPLSGDPADWYGAVAAYAGAAYRDDARTFADEVYATLRTGAARSTDDGHAVTLAADPGLTPDTSRLDALGLPAQEQSETDCPPDLPCEWIPATYRLTDAFGDYANHDKADRPRDQKIDYIVIHDTEGQYPGVIKLIQDPVRAASWHYSLRSSDGHVAQHIRTRDVAWQAGNWAINAKSIGLEHEGFAAQQGAWYTEAMYRSSAKLVRYLAERYDVPLDRAHIIGHDNVPGTTTANIRNMHWDPGPYWDWNHYMNLLDAPSPAIGFEKKLVMIQPDFDTNLPAFTGCAGASTTPCPPSPSSSVILRSAPSPDAPLLNDLGLRPGGQPATMVVSDVGSRASTGQVYAVADRSGEWLAIWYHGLKGWFHNPEGAEVAKFVAGTLVTPKAGREAIPVYGRAYPEAEAYPPEVPYQPVSAHPYVIRAGQAYSYGGWQYGEYYRAVTFDGSGPYDRTVIRGQTKYYEIQIGHRIGFVKADDVDVVTVS
ncbi:N-acetylmuramoyl-L-alanine amidase [Streptomyces polyrhachis]|uniref:N-acetylmuramoyl-L-alanine amidase n=1 Tax=Streptomyces polyrhachis TaxID=1282885 RepID=A0ABW2GNW4_9ACTN